MTTPATAQPEPATPAKMDRLRERILVAAYHFAAEELALRAERARHKALVCEYPNCPIRCSRGAGCPTCEAFFAASVYNGSLRKRYAAKRAIVTAYQAMQKLIAGDAR